MYRGPLNEARGESSTMPLAPLPVGSHGRHGGAGEAEELVVASDSADGPSSPLGPDSARGAFAT